MSRTRSGRAVFGLNASFSVALAVLVAAVALVVQPPAPPGIAAFAPQATKPITKAPPGQSSVNGSGTGSCADGQVCTSAGKPTPPPATASDGPVASVAKGVPSALQCYTWPDGTVTQTFDPQSPPCIATWPEQANGNGGATSPGVSATEIRVAVPTASDRTSDASLKLLAQFFNTRYQFYGRRIVLVPYPSQQVVEANSVTNYADPSAQKADAEQAASVHPFAATDFVAGDYAAYVSTLPEYLDTLAKHRVITMSGGASPVSTSSLDKHAPYQWSYLPTTASLVAGVAGLTCRQLAGRSATHSTVYQAVERKFAVVLPDPANRIGHGALPGLQRMLDRLAACGVKSPRVVYYKSADNGVATSMAQLKSENVTTLLFYPTGETSNSTPQNAAQSVGYFPEWVAFGGSAYSMANLLAGSPQETANTFGVASWNKILSLAEEPWRRALLMAGGSGTEFFPGGKGFYVELQLLASGIQMAGPKLTPETFASALAGTTFPNPGAGKAPSYQARVGFERQKHEMMSDFAGFWLDPSATPAGQQRALMAQDYEYSQGFCYVGVGTRWGADDWPAQDRFLQGRCR